MSLFVVDTDILSLYYHSDAAVVRRLRARPQAELAISVMTVDEQLSGWYTVTRQARKTEQLVEAYSQLAEAVIRLATWRILPYTESAIARVSHLKTLKLNIGVMDLRIAAIALDHGAVVVSRNRRDFSRIPGLIVEDWSV